MMSGKKFTKTFNVDYQLLFNDWYPYLKDALNNSVYYNNLFVYINEVYKQRTVYPAKNKVFNAFKMTSFNDLRVVIIRDEPYGNSKDIGLAIANKDDIRESLFSPYLYKLRQDIERELYDGLQLDFDPTLTHWCKQGILLLNTALTVESGKPGSHIKYWHRFTSDIINIINTNKTGIIFCILGENAKQYKSLINDNVHYILEDEFPYIEINNIITKQNGKEFCIKW